MILSPHDIRVLLHVHAISEPWPTISSAFEGGVEEFVSKGAIVRDVTSGSGYRTTPLGDAWVHLICNVPPPRAVFLDSNGREIILGP